MGRPRVVYRPASSAFGEVNSRRAAQAMAKIGYSDLKEFQRVGLGVRLTRRFEPRERTQPGGPDHVPLPGVEQLDVQYRVDNHSQFDVPPTRSRIEAPMARRGDQIAALMLM